MNDVSKDEKTKVLFGCLHNSARSQMAEAFLNHLAGDRFEAESAGLEPGPLNPLAIEVMDEVGIDISMNQAKSVFALYKADRLYRYVVSVCDEAAQRCPIFPGFATNLHWSFEDPASFTGSHEERLDKTRRVRDEIKKKIEKFIKEQHGGSE
ncbi:MAG TPA: arsenate reductase ArsC [Deltaproteobacteria bacterium]|nr:arsenate reductase ArsC [Deltaproteobacteria bacterium]